MSEHRIIISGASILLFFSIGLSLALLWQLKGLLMILMIAIVIASALAPLIEKAEKLKIPRKLAIIWVYLSIIAILTGVGLLIGPAIAEQIERIFQRLPDYLSVLTFSIEDMAVRLGMDRQDAIDRLKQLFDRNLVNWAFNSSQSLLAQSLGLTRGLIGGILSLLLALLLSGYMLSSSQSLLEGLVSLFPKPWNRRLKAQIAPVSKRMGGYIQGRMLVSAILGIAVTIGLNVLGISEYALGLGAIAGITNLIPFFGPVLGSIPALIVALVSGGWTFLWVLLLFLTVQNVETYFLDPLLVGPSVKIPPLYQLLAVLSGTMILGILGALIFPPWVAGASVLLENLYLKPKLRAEHKTPEKVSRKVKIRSVPHRKLKD